MSGGMDTLVLLWDLGRGEIVEKMEGHQFQVTGIAIDDNGDIISSSLDWYCYLIFVMNCNIYSCAP